MLQRLYAQFPPFARPSNPLMRYTVIRTQPMKRRWRIFRAITIIFITVVLAITGYEIATGGGASPLDAANPLDKIFLITYWPLVFVMLLARLFAITSTVGIISNEAQRGTWDTLKVTTDGAQLFMKTRWWGVFYRLWALLAIILVLRLVFIVTALISLSYFQGRYLDLLLSGTIPFGPPNISQDASTLIGILIMSITMTVSLLAPFTAVAFDAALGMLIGTFSRGRFVGILGQVLLLIGRVFITGLALWTGAYVLSLAPFSIFPAGTFTAMGNRPLLSWLGAFFGAAEGDLGMSLLHLDHVQRYWADLDYGALIGVGLLGYILLQAGLANLIVKWAGRRAARAGQL